MNKELKCGVVGATGYSGVELLRLLNQHPQATICKVTSRTEAGRKVAEIFPTLSSLELQFESPENTDFNACDVVFLSLIHI